ncbi:sarcosine oxidase subunit gamma [Marinomonas sp. 42_23_T18]|nr:sarcosine oxidase subunit gamma [Marinomonas sp. 42_23_T18]
MDFYNLSSANKLRRSMLNLEHSESLNSRIKMQDATAFSRVGFRGQGVERFLAEQGLAVPSAPNQSVLSDTGLVVLRLSKTEFWILDTDNAQHELIAALELASKGLSQVYRLYCQHSHAFFLIRGKEISNLFAKICGVDLSESAFAVTSIAQTSVARTNAIVVRQERNDEAFFLLLSDLASSQYLWDAIVDAATEFA